MFTIQFSIDHFALWGNEMCIHMTITNELYIFLNNLHHMFTFIWISFTFAKVCTQNTILSTLASSTTLTCHTTTYHKLCQWFRSWKNFSKYWRQLIINQNPSQFLLGLDKQVVKWELVWIHYFEGELYVCAESMIPVLVEGSHSLVWFQGFNIFKAVPTYIRSSAVFMFGKKYLT